MEKRQIRRNRKMTDADVAWVVQELEHWANKERGTQLTWEKIEKFSRFTRQALSAKGEVVTAYNAAKKALRNPDRKAKSRQVEGYAEHLEGLLKGKDEALERYKKLEEQWLARWQRIAYHARVRGLTMSELDQPLPSANRK